MSQTRGWIHLLGRLRVGVSITVNSVQIMSRDGIRGLTYILESAFVMDRLCISLSMSFLKNPKFPMFKKKKEMLLKGHKLRRERKTYTVLNPLPTVGTKCFRRLFCGSGGRNTARRERIKNSAARSVRRRFFWIPPTEFCTISKETSLSIRQSGIKVSGLHKQSFPKKFFFRVGTNLASTSWDKPLS